MTEERATQLNQVLADIQFENKSKYEFEIMPLSNVVLVKRQLVCTVTNKPTPIYNSFRLLKDFSDEDFIKLLFVAVGQFETHEFVESFKYKGTHAYFPHISGGKIKTLYGESNKINNLLLAPWHDIVLQRSYMRIGLRYIRLGILGMLGQILKPLDLFMDMLCANIETAIMFPIRYIRSRNTKPTEVTNEIGK